MLSFSLERRHRVVLVRFSDVLTHQDLLDHDRMAKAIHDRHGFMRGIVDFSGVTAVQVPTSEFAERARRTPVMGDVPRIFVAPQPALFGLARVYTSHHQRVGHNDPVLVRALDEAFNLFGLDNPRFEPVDWPDGAGQDGPDVT